MKTAIATHTPPPWKSENSTFYCYPFDESDDSIVGSTILKRDAAFIVRAVNSHAELLETIRWMAQTIHQAYHEKDTFMECLKNTCDAAKQAISKAEAL